MLLLHIPKKLHLLQSHGRKHKVHLLNFSFLCYMEYMTLYRLGMAWSGIKDESPCIKTIWKETPAFFSSLSSLTAVSHRSTWIWYPPGSFWWAVCFVAQHSRCFHWFFILPSWEQVPSGSQNKRFHLCRGQTDTILVWNLHLEAQEGIQS